MTDLTFACVLRSGSIYNADWVRRLRDGVARHLSLPHRFVCLSDVDVPCERIALKTNWPGWWSKIELFSGDLTGPVFYCDLDSIPVGNLDEIASYPHRFTAAHDFYHGGLCSTAMAWNGDYRFIYDAFARRPERIARHYDNLLHVEKRIGDQAFIEDQLQGHKVEFFRDVCGPRSIASYKVDECFDAPPADAGIVAFHGTPKPHKIKSGWVKEHWQ